MKCSECKGEMEEGLIAFWADAHLTTYQRWGIKMKKGFLQDESELENEREVKNYRCKKCGYLMSYAK